ncbi:MAG: ThuA domain-containing protein [Halioglobus sp.]|nr:ThuA domain-containing protein [Halioglobus sp.]
MNTKHPSLLRRAIKWLLVLVIVLAVAALGALWWIGAWNLVFPNQDHDSVAPALPGDLTSPAVLVFSKTNGFRHREGIAGGAEALQAMAARHGWGLFHTENGAVFNAADLSRFRVVVFLNASGDMLNEAQEQAFQAWMEQGGGWLGIHAAGDSSHAGWQWYRDNLIGADFTAHIMDPQFQIARVILENHQHPVLKGIPDLWEHEEEWYSWERSPRAEGFLILATLDEESYTPEARFLGAERDLRMGDHPVVWANCVGDGHSVYAAMGHRADAFTQPQVARLLENALLWLTGPRDSGCELPMITAE